MEEKRKTYSKRKKNVIEGTAEVKRRDYTAVSNKKVGHGRHNDGSYIGGYLTQKKYINKKTGKPETEEEYEMRKHAKGFLVENLEPTRPGSLVKRRRKK